MKRAPDIGRPARPAEAAPPTPTRPGQLRSALGVLADPRTRLGLGAAVTLLTAVAAHGNHVGRTEARAFQLVNGLPDTIYRPTWVVMQLGTLGAAPAAAGAAWLAHDSELACRLLAGGASTWALSKLVKRLVRRPRPATLLTNARSRGADATGLGYLSGHAGVAAALSIAALPRLSPAGRTAAVAAAPIVGLSRIYVGAHLPLDIAGGATLGMAVDAAVALLQQRVSFSHAVVCRR
jgi:membrane-associated phospholipid phosphatase